MIQIRVSWEIQNEFLAIFCEALVELIEIIWLHLRQIKHIIFTVAGTWTNQYCSLESSEVAGHTSPWWTSEDDSVLLPCEPADGFEAVATEPEDLVRDAVDFCVVLRALQRLRILFNGKYPLPTT